MPIDNAEAAPGAVAPKPPHHSRWSLSCLLLGGVGLIATCVCYAMAGPVAALPGGAGGWPEAIQATLDRASWMRAAGLWGVPSDVLLAVGSALLALESEKVGHTGLTIGWMLLGLAGALFIPVDTIVGQALPIVAADPAAQSSYGLLRTVFDAAFAWGALVAGAGALLLAWASVDAAPSWRLSLVVAAGGCLLSGIAYAGGWTALGPLAGPAIALLAFTISLWAALRLRQRVLQISLQGV